MDVCGHLFDDHWAGRIEPHVIERDDGRSETFESAQLYFAAPRSEVEREFLNRLEGPVLDLGAGAGSYALYLQERGIHVTAADSSLLGLEVCRRRGCNHVQLMDIRSLDLEPGSFQSVIVMGNTLGAHQTPATFPSLLQALYRSVSPSGRLLCTMIDPLQTNDEVHLEYHRKNREQGLPPGLIRIRLNYRDLVDDWMHLWMPTEEEFLSIATKAGWELDETRLDGPHRVWLLEKH